MFIFLRKLKLFEKNLVELVWWNCVAVPWTCNSRLRIKFIPIFTFFQSLAAEKLLFSANRPVTKISSLFITVFESIFCSNSLALEMERFTRLYHKHLQQEWAIFFLWGPFQWNFWPFGIHFTIINSRKLYFIWNITSSCLQKAASRAVLRPTLSFKVSTRSSN